MYRKIQGGITAPKDFLSAGTHCGMKMGGKDLALVYSAVPCIVAGTFTRNLVKAAPVVLTQKRVSKGRAQAVIINSGNANCATGKRGLADAVSMGDITAKELAINPDAVLVCSTGGIGKYLPMEKITKGIPELVKGLSTGNSDDAAKAILTTDLTSKQIAVEFKVGKKKVTVGAMAKGSGMICPDMATMLAFITTDAIINPAFMRKALKNAVEYSFNRISVDGDMSTNDSVLLFANGAAGNAEITEKKRSGKAFIQALTFVCSELARQIVLDGEGATKFVTVRVEKAQSKKNADTVARRIADSPLVKTAIYGENPNWGRILSSIGCSGVKLNPEKVSVFINELQVVKGGVRADYDSKKAFAEMKKSEILVRVDLSSGMASGEIWTCDFSHKYVDINI